MSTLLPVRLGIDLDGVLANFIVAYTRLFIALTGRNRFGCEPEEVAWLTWNHESAVGYTAPDMRKVWGHIKDAREEFWLQLQPYDDAPAFLHWLAQVPYETYFITQRPGDSAQRQTVEWLQAWGYRQPQVAIARDEKGLLTRGLGLTYVLDDRPENLVSTRITTPHCACFLLDRLWNRGEKVEKVCRQLGIQRIASVWEFQRAVEMRQE